jgi:hypothetical protein
LSWSVAFKVPFSSISAPNRGFWIGMKRISTQKSYSWSDNEVVKFTHWDTHQPRGFSRVKGSCAAVFLQVDICPKSEVSDVTGRHWPSTISKKWYLRPINLSFEHLTYLILCEKARCSVPVLIFSSLLKSIIE